jgi:hypothetical protein
VNPGSKKDRLEFELTPSDTTIDLRTQLLIATSPD